MKTFISLFLVFSLFACELNENSSYTTQMNDERVIIVDNRNNIVNFFTKNGLLINRVDLITMQSQKIDLTLKFEKQIHNWNDTIFVEAELMGDKLYWEARTSSTNTRDASNLSFRSSRGMEIYLCYSCGWNPVYGTEEGKTTSYYTSGIVNNITLEEFSNIEGFGFRAKNKIQEKRVQGKVLTDGRDGRRYNTVAIGKQVWMAENLNYNASGSKCYDNQESSCQKYGRLYDWNTAMVVCPKGWHLPSYEEWDVLMAVVGGEETAGEHLKAKSGWSNNGSGLDTYGFSALPGGHSDSSDVFFSVGNIGLWWSATEMDASNVSYWGMLHNYADVGRYYDDKTALFSVRCVQYCAHCKEIAPRESETLYYSPIATHGKMFLRANGNNLYNTVPAVLPD